MWINIDYMLQVLRMEEGHISNSDNELDIKNNENDESGSDYEDEDLPAMVQNPSFGLNDPKVQEQLSQISTEGVSVYEMADLHLNASKLDLKQCAFCNKFFKQDMVVPILNDNKKNKNTVDEIQCWHCLFWMNYPVSSRKNVDGILGMTIVDYILKCKDVHEMATCTRNSDSGGCFLCEYNLGFPLTDVKDLYKLSDSSEVPDHPIEDDDRIEMDDSYQPGQITVEI